MSDAWHFETVEELRQQIADAIRDRDEALEYVEQMRCVVRDEFAMAALTGIIAADGRGTYDELAKEAYTYADAMMARRGQ